MNSVFRYAGKVRKIPRTRQWNYLINNADRWEEGGKLKN